MTSLPLRRLHHLHDRLNARSIAPLCQQLPSESKRLQRQIVRAQRFEESQGDLAQRMWRLQYQRVSGLRQAGVLAQRWGKDMKVPTGSRQAHRLSQLLRNTRSTLSRMAAPLWEWLMEPVVDIGTSKSPSTDGALNAKAA